MVAVTHTPMEPRWEDVRLFLALYRKRSLANAAVVVGLDPSTLSRRLATLEESVGTRLFERTREGMVPTHDAELLLPAAEEMAAAHAQFARDSSGVERNAEGVVRLSVPPGIAELIVAPALVRLRSQHPRIQVEAEIGFNFLDLSRREAELAVRTQRPRAGELVSLKLSQQPWTPMTAADGAARLGKVTDWNALNWIGWGEDLQSFGPARWLDKHVERTSVVLRTSQLTMHTTAVEAGLGVALLPLTFARVASVAPLSVDASLNASMEELPTNELWLVGHRALRSVPRIAAVWSFLLEEFQRFEADPLGSELESEPPKSGESFQIAR
jgi:DNA-binding transcriptional LysR family regulator